MDYNSHNEIFWVLMKLVELLNFVYVNNSTHIFNKKIKMSNENEGWILTKFFAWGWHIFLIFSVDDLIGKNIDIFCLCWHPFIIYRSIVYIKCPCNVYKIRVHRAVKP